MLLNSSTCEVKKTCWLLSLVLDGATGKLIEFPEFLDTLVWGAFIVVGIEFRGGGDALFEGRETSGVFVVRGGDEDVRLGAACERVHNNKYLPDEGNFLPFD